MSDPRLWRVLKNGYPYKTPSEMSVDDWLDAYMCTRYALYCVIGEYDPDQRIKARDSAGERMKNCIKNLVNIARNESDIYKEPSATVLKSGNLITETIGGVKFKTQKYTVSSSFSIKQYEVSTQGFPNGTKILDNANNEKDIFTSNTFKIAIPFSSINNNIDGVIRVQNIELKTYPVLFGDSSNSSWQDYVLVMDPYENYRTNTELNINTYKSGITVIKKDKETNTPIANTVFTVYDSSNKSVGTITTDKEGKGSLTELLAGTYTVKETKANEDYVLSKVENKVTLGFEEVKILDLTNEKKTGQIKVVKIDKDNKELKLQGVEFEILDKNGKVVQTLITDSNGEAISNKLAIDMAYFVKETKTSKLYVLNEEAQIAVLKENEITTLTFENEKKKWQINVVKIDENTKKIIKDKFTFGIYKDKECEELLQQVDSNIQEGIVEFKDLREGTYYIKEISSPKNYVLSERIMKLEINENGVFIDEKQIKEDSSIYTFEFSNKKLETPETDDNRNIMVWYILLGTSGAVLLILVIYKSRKKK